MDIPWCCEEGSLASGVIISPDSCHFLQAECIRVSLLNNSGTKFIIWRQTLPGKSQDLAEPMLKAAAVFLIPGGREQRTVAISCLLALQTGVIRDHRDHLPPAGRQELAWGQAWQETSCSGMVSSQTVTAGSLTPPPPWELRAYCVPGPMEPLPRWHLRHPPMDPVQERSLNRDPERWMVPVSGGKKLHTEVCQMTQPVSSLIPKCSIRGYVSAAPRPLARTVHPFPNLGGPGC